MANRCSSAIQVYVDNDSEAAPSPIGPFRVASHRPGIHLADQPVVPAEGWDS